MVPAGVSSSAYRAGLPPLCEALPHHHKDTIMSVKLKTRYYHELHKTEIGLTRTHWSWFPATDSQGVGWYSNSHVITRKSPVKDFPMTMPKGYDVCCQHERWDNMLDLTQVLTTASRRTKSSEPLMMAYATEREGRFSKPGYKPGMVELRNTKGQVTLMRHYYALVTRQWVDAEVFTHGQNNPAVFKVDGHVVAMIAQYLPQDKTL